jgi:uncharacterized membrane protein YkvA (DUF1232 family)
MDLTPVLFLVALVFWAAKFLRIRRAVKQESPVKKIVPALAALYVVMPLDLIPDFLPIIGWIDDIIAIVIGVKAAFKK